MPVPCGGEIQRLWGWGQGVHTPGQLAPAFCMTTDGPPNPPASCVHFRTDQVEGRGWSRVNLSLLSRTPDCGEPSNRAWEPYPATQWLVCKIPP